VMTLLEVLAMLTLAGLGAMFFRRRIRRGSALALVFAGLCTLLALPTGASATGIPKRGRGYRLVRRDHQGGHVRHGERDECGSKARSDGDLIVFCESLDISGHVTGDVINFSQSARISGRVDGNVRGANNNLTITGTVSKNVLTFEETLTIDPAGKVGGSLTNFSANLGMEGSVGRDALLFVAHAHLEGKIGWRSPSQRGFVVHMAGGR